MRLICTTDRQQAEALAGSAEGTPILLYGHSKRGSVGGPVYKDLRRWPDRVTQGALDLLSVALAVTAGDRFIRHEDAADRWTRDIELVIPVAEPLLWAPVGPALTGMLNFLTSDRWSVTFTGGGMTVAELYRDRRLGLRRAPPDGDCVCLFSGGMDSYLGAADLVHRGRRPLLVSQYQPGEQTPQGRLRGSLGLRWDDHFLTNPHPVAPSGRMDTQQRARSFLFVALAAAIGSASLQRRNGNQRFDLFIPENGYIALNAPLTPARSGSCSTRTVHPRTVKGMQEVLDRAGIPATLHNPFAGKTKGEMVAEVAAAMPVVVGHLHETISCGAYRRNKFQQCGHCIPCLIRRAALLRAGQEDRTTYKIPRPAALWRENSKWGSAGNLAAMELALADEDTVLRRLRLTFKGVPVDRWAALEEVHTKGLHEVERVIGTL